MDNEWQIKLLGRELHLGGAIKPYEGMAGNLGVKVSVAMQHDILAVLTVCADACEDANLHTEAKYLRQRIKAIESDEVD